MMRNRAGFTLIELFVVMTIGSLLALIAMPHIDVAGTRAQSAARSAHIALAAAQQRAVLRQHDVVVRFDEDASAMRFFDDANNNGTLDAGEVEWTHQLEDNMTFGRGLAPVGPPGADAISFDAGGDGLPRLTFRRSGSASQAGGFYVSSPRAAVSTSHIDHAYGITVSRATGRVRMHRVVRNSWTEAF